MVADSITVDLVKSKAPARKARSKPKPIKKPEPKPPKAEPKKSKPKPKPPKPKDKPVIPKEKPKEKPKPKPKEKPKPKPKPKLTAEQQKKLLEKLYGKQPNKPAPKQAGKIGKAKGLTKGEQLKMLGYIRRWDNMPSSIKGVDGIEFTVDVILARNGYIEDIKTHRRRLSDPEKQAKHDLAIREFHGYLSKIGRYPTEILPPQNKYEGTNGWREISFIINPVRFAD